MSRWFDKGCALTDAENKGTWAAFMQLRRRISTMVVSPLLDAYSFTKRCVLTSQNDISTPVVVIHALAMILGNWWKPKNIHYSSSFSQEENTSLNEPPSPFYFLRKSSLAIYQFAEAQFQPKMWNAAKSDLLGGGSQKTILKHSCINTKIIISYYCDVLSLLRFYHVSCLCFVVFVFNYVKKTKTIVGQKFGVPGSGGHDAANIVAA